MTAASATPTSTDLLVRRKSSDAAARASVGDASVEGSRAAGAAGAGWAFVFFVAFFFCDERLRVFIEFETSFKGFLLPVDDRVLGAIGDFRRVWDALPQQFL
mgnify:CR=1 FL=1